MLSIAVDTLRQRNKKNNFIENFIKDRGYPVWDAASTFYQVGLPVMLVPVKQPAQKKVSGILFLSLNNTQPVYRWIPRNSDYDGSAFLTKKELEEFMLMFEQKLFGEVQTPGIKVEVREEVGVNNHGKKEDSVSGIVITTSNCGRTSASNGASWGAWQCDFGIYWVRAIDSGSGGSDPGGFGGSGGEIPGGGTASYDPPVSAPAGVSQEFYEGLNTMEKALCVLHVDECINVFAAKITAENWAPYYAPLSGPNAGWNDPQDALRHARWNAEMTKKIGPSRAKEWGDAHEYVDPGNNDPHANDPIARNMDLHNNQVGRDIGENFPDNIANAILNARDNGELWLWRCRETQTRFGCGDTPED